MNSTNCTCNETDCKGCPVVYLATWTIVLLDIMYVIIVIIGVIGNIMTCAATIMQKSMRRSVHLYVFNLAVCDLLILIFYVPNEMMRMEHQARYVWGPVMCALTYVVLPIAINSTVFTLLAISLDRTRGVLQPFEWRADSKGGAFIIIPIIWVIAISIAIPPIIYARLHPFNNGLVCMDHWPNPSHAKIYWLTIFAITFAIPLVIIFVLHLIMIYILYMGPKLTEQTANKRMIKMVILIVFIFTICTGSQHFYFFMQTFHQEMSTSTDAMLFFGSNLFVSVQSACNPILYGTFRQDFNIAFRNLIAKVGGLLRLGKSVASPHINNFKDTMLSMKSTKKVANGKMTPTSSETRYNIYTPLIDSSSSSEPTCNVYVPEDDCKDPSNALRSVDVISPSVDDTLSHATSESCSPDLDVRLSMRSPTPNISRVDSRPPSGDSRPYSCDSRPPSGVTFQIKEITKLLMELKQHESVENLASKPRISGEFVRLSESEQGDLCASYPSVEWLDFLHICPNARETVL